MQRLAQIQLQKTVTVKVQCNLNDEIVVKNFKILMDCLKDLNSSHNDLLSKFQKISDRVSSLQQHNQHNKNQKTNQSKQSALPQSASQHQHGGLNQSDKQNLLNLIKKLDGRTTQNEKNILDNIKDINLINKQIADLKQLISKIGGGGNNSNNVTDGKKDGANFQSISNISKELHHNKELINKMNQQLEKLRKEVQNIKQKHGKTLQDHEKRIKGLQNNSGSNRNDQSGSQDLSKAEFNQLRQKVAILNKKTNGLQLLSQQLKNQTASLGEGQQALQNSHNNLIKQLEDLKQKINNILKNKGGNDKIGGGLGSDDLRQIKNQLKQLRSQIQQLKRDNNNHSKTSIEQDKKKFDRGSLTQVKFRDDSLKDLIARVDYLQKMMGSKNSIDDKQKLPLIKRNRLAKDRDVSTNQKSTSKKDIAEMKAEIQAWVNNYLMEMKSKDNFEDIQLKLQEIKNSLNKKADQEGMKKGLTFLQSKINQLYLFLTEPQGDDAMIVRKGFNCLSCSKKVQKLRGKIGPHINWNNMTATNYSPPKVGYSRHMGEEGDREEDQ